MPAAIPIGWARPGKGSGRFNARGRGATAAAGLKGRSAWSRDASGGRTRARRVTMKARIVKLNPQRGAARGRSFVSAKAVDAHLRYLERDGVNRDGVFAVELAARRRIGPLIGEPHLAPVEINAIVNAGGRVGEIGGNKALRRGTAGVRHGRALPGVEDLPVALRAYCVGILLLRRSLRAGALGPRAGRRARGHPAGSQQAGEQNRERQAVRGTEKSPAIHREQRYHAVAYSCLRSRGVFDRGGVLSYLGTLLLVLICALVFGIVYHGEAIRGWIVQAAKTGGSAYVEAINVIYPAHEDTASAARENFESLPARERRRMIGSTEGPGSDPRRSAVMGEVAA